MKSEYRAVGKVLNGEPERKAAGQQQDDASDSAVYVCEEQEDANASRSFARYRNDSKCARSQGLAETDKRLLLNSAENGIASTIYHV